jgi:hypothetical protein
MSTAMLFLILMRRTRSSAQKAVAMAITHKRVNGGATKMASSCLKEILILPIMGVHKIIQIHTNTAGYQIPLVEHRNVALPNRLNTHD